MFILDKLTHNSSNGVSISLGCLRRRDMADLEHWKSRVVWENAQVRF